MIDGYAHLGLPRFWGADDYLPVMDAMGISAALVCPFDSCADLAECHRAMSLHPDRFRGFGLALGTERSEVERGIMGQLDAGFEGLRIGDAQLARQPWILDALGKEKAVAMVVGGRALADVAASLLAHLDRWPDAVVIAPHFAGPDDPDVLEGPGASAALFSHPRFFVVMSRQGLFPEMQIGAWAEALIGVCGWDRLMWGSEAPIPCWRDEQLAATPAWIKRFTKDEGNLTAFYADTARRALLDRPRRPVAPLSLPFDPRQHEVASLAPMFPFGLSTDTRLPARVVQGWLASGGETRQPLSAYVSLLIERGLARDAAE